MQRGRAFGTQGYLDIKRATFRHVSAVSVSLSEKGLCVQDRGVSWQLQFSHLPSLGLGTTFEVQKNDTCVMCACGIYLQCTASLANKLMKMDQAWPSDLTKNSQTAKNCKGRMLNDSLRRIPLTTKASCDICYQHLSATQTDDLTYAICYHSHRLAN